MPAPVTTPEQQQKHGMSNSMHKPYYPQQMQHLLLGSSQQGQGSPAASASPAAPGWPYQHASNTPTEAVRQQHSHLGNGKSGSAAGQLQMARSVHAAESLPGPLAALFSAAAASSSGAAGAEAKSTSDVFRFDRQAILHVL
jgi:hypothetical protein